MKKSRKKPASVTVPLCISLTVTAALILGLVEGARYYGLKEDAKEYTNLTVESLFAGYQQTLLDEYQMFFLDGNFGGDHFNIAAAEDRMAVLLQENFMDSENGGVNLYRMAAAEVEIKNYMLATDGNGRVFEAQAAERMKKAVTRSMAEKILQKIDDVKAGKEQAPDPEKAIADAKEAFNEPAKETGESADSSQGKSSEAEGKENPLDQIEALQKKGILALVLPSEKSVSAKTVPTDKCLTKRNLKKGTYKSQKSGGWYERILMQEFIKPLIGNALSPKENGRLSYGAEYLICGRESDEKNLKKTAEKLLLLREGMNFLYLQTDEKKKAEALAAATALAAASANPLVIAAVKQGILAAWAYAESICDVKELFAGGKAPLIKTAASWKSSLAKLEEAINANYGNGREGLSYENYLDVLLYERTVKQIAYRSMDLMEWQLQKEPGCGNCKMDHMIAGLNMEAEYDADTLFFGIFAKDHVLGYRFLEKAEYIYGQK